MVRPIMSHKVLFYLDLKVSAVRRKLSRLMDKSSGPDVRHTWGLKSHPFIVCVTLASSLTSPSLSFTYKMGINRCQRIQWENTHRGPTPWPALSSRGVFYLKGSDGGCNPSRF